MARRAALAAMLTSFLLGPGLARGEAAGEPPWRADRGPGVRTSIFGTYVRPGELMFMPFAEGYWDQDFEYDPAELGYSGTLDQDFRGKYRAAEGLVFFAYGLSDRLAVELEAAVITAKLEKAADDPSSMPQSVEDSGQGDWQTQLDWRMAFETATRPELFSFLELTPPSNESSPLIGTPDWEFKLGVGAEKGLPWGTVTGRVAAAYSMEEDAFELGEYAVEWLKRLSPRWRLYSGIEGEQDEVELIGEAQYFLTPGIFLRLNMAYGLTSKATDWAPDVGVMFSFPRR